MSARRIIEYIFNSERKLSLSRTEIEIPSKDIQHIKLQSVRLSKKTCNSRLLELEDRNEKRMDKEQVINLLIDVIGGMNKKPLIVLLTQNNEE